MISAVLAFLPVWIASADPVTIAVTWKGNGTPSPAGDNINWSDPNNWQPGVVPKNQADTLWFNVTLPAGISVTYDAQKTIPGPDTLAQSLINNFALSNNATLILTSSGATVPSLGINGAAILAGILDIRGGTFNATAAGSSFLDNGTSSTNRARVYASGGAVVHIAAPSYSSTGLVARSDFNTLNWNLFTASGAGTLLDLSAIQTLNAGYSGQINTINRQNITASGGAVINFSGIKTITSPNSVNDWLQFNVSGPAPTLIDLSALHTIFGPLHISIDSGGSLVAGRLLVAQATLTGDGSLLKTLNNLAAGNATLTQGSGAKVSVGQDLRLGSGATYTVAAKGIVEIGRDFLFATADESKLALKPASLLFNGSASHVVEVGGVDVATVTAILTNTNFALGAMQVGSPGHATTVNLMDLANNGNRASPSSFEALYLNYDGADLDQNGTPGDEGLYVAAGSTLDLHGLHVYAWHNSALTLVTPTPAWSNGGGAIISSATTQLAGDVNFDGVVNSHDIDIEFAAINGHSNHPFFDLNGDNTLTVADEATLLHNILHKGDGDANLNGVVDIQDQSIVTNNWQQTFGSYAEGDLNGDGIVDIQDLTLVTNNWQQTTSFPLTENSELRTQNSVPVPEPATLLFLAVPLLLTKPRRHTSVRTDLCPSSPAHD